MTVYQRSAPRSSSSFVRIWEISTREPVGKPISHASGLLGAAFSPDGERILIACGDRTARFWLVETGEPIGAELRHDAKLSNVACSPDGLHVVTVWDDRSAWLWNLGTTEPLAVRLQHVGQLVTAGFSPDGKSVLTAFALRGMLWRVAMEPLNATGYMAAPGFEELLLADLEDAAEVHGRLVLAPGAERRAPWAQNVWRRPHRIRVSSIADAARRLRALGRNWALYSFHLHRRASLIQAALPHVSAKPLELPAAPPRAPLGSWTLLEPDLVLASPDCSSPFPHGEARFVEHHRGPPSRAYLKLWEALTLLGRRPGPGERCLDAGASPGSWSWALSRLGAQVIAVDRAALDPGVAALPGVEYRKGSAFSVEPRGGERFDWIFSDVVCYPERLFRWVKSWVDAGPTNLVCTVKFQGTSHYRAIADFAAVPGSRLIHLSSNRHELTWMWPAGAS